jgi:RNA-binding protein
MAMTAKDRRQLLADSHRLSPAVTLKAGELSDAMLAQVRSSFTRQALVKVRINADSAAECDSLAAELAEGVPCELVKRIGRVAVLYRAGGTSER